MKLDAARHRLAHSEAATVAARQALQRHVADLSRHSRAALTPTRLLLGGLLTGSLLARRRRPLPLLRAAPPARLLDLIGTASSLISALRAHRAAQQASVAAAGEDQDASAEPA